MIEILIILIIWVITILLVLALCKVSKRADRNAQIILKSGNFCSKCTQCGD